LFETHKQEHAAPWQQVALAFLSFLVPHACWRQCQVSHDIFRMGLSKPAVKASVSDIRLPATSSNQFLTASHCDVVQTQSKRETRLQCSHHTVSWWCGWGQSVYPWSYLNFHKNIVGIWI
jgi:hypothetical protein